MEMFMINYWWPRKWQYAYNSFKLGGDVHRRVIFNNLHEDHVHGRGTQIACKIKLIVI